MNVPYRYPELSLFPAVKPRGSARPSRTYGHPYSLPWVASFLVLALSLAPGCAPIFVASEQLPPVEGIVTQQIVKGSVAVEVNPEIARAPTTLFTVLPYGGGPVYNQGWRVPFKEIVERTTQASGIFEHFAVGVPAQTSRAARAIPVSVDQVELDDARVHPEGPAPLLTGRLRNRSTLVLTDVSIKIAFYDGQAKVAEAWVGGTADRFRGKTSGVKGINDMRVLPGADREFAVLLEAAVPARYARVDFQVVDPWGMPLDEPAATQEKVPRAQDWDYTIRVNLRVQKGEFNEFVKLLNVSTLGAIPVGTTHAFQLTVEVRDRKGEVLKSYELADSMMEVQHPLFIPVALVAAGPEEVASRVVENMVKTAYQRILQDGLLRSRDLTSGPDHEPDGPSEVAPEAGGPLNRP